ncbi:MAG: hypothetical protein AB8C84_09230 [Oligoflexales bacterium]
MSLKIQRRTSVPADVIRQYRHRILSLEVELQEMAREGSLGRRHVKSSIQNLRHLKALLSTLQSMRSITKPQMPEGIKVPDLDLCDIAAQNFCVKWSQNQTVHTRSLAEKTGQVAVWVRKALAGEGFDWVVLFRLSKLRKMLANIESKTIETEHDYKQLEIAVQVLQKGESDRPPVEILSRIYQNLCEQNDHIERMEYELQAEIDHTSWMKRWLMIQEERLKTYFPVVSRNIQLGDREGA